MLKTKQPGTLKEQIYQSVFESIICGEYKPNDILSEKSLVEKFQVSKSPVREALIELCNENILRSIPRYGYEVIRITDREVEEICQYRLLLEVSALDHNWQMLTNTHADTLQQMLMRNYGTDMPYDVLEHWDYNCRFHLQLVSCFNNEYLYRNLKAAMQVLARAYAQFYWDKWHQTHFFSSAGYHKKLVECIRTNDKRLALLYLERDISGFDGDESGLRPSEPGVSTK